jgi:succinoglycan biosynthesis transport protein ExoP
MEPSRYTVRRLPPPENTIDTELSPVFVDPTEPLIDVWSYWRTLHKHVRLIAAVALGVIILTALHVATATRMYTAETTVLIQPNPPGGSDNLKNLLEIEAASINADQYYKTQCAVLESRNIAASVIKLLDLAHNSAFTEQPRTPDMFSRLWSRLTAMVSIPAGRDVTQRAANNGTGVPARALDDEDVSQVPLSLVHAYLGALKVTPVENTNLVKISFSTPDPNLSAELANKHVYAYEHQQVLLRSHQDADTEQFLKAKLLEVKESLEKSEAALNDYRRKKGIIPGLISLDGKDAVVLDRLTDLSKDLTRAQVGRIGLEAEVQLIHKHDYNSLPPVMRSATIQGLDKDLDTLFADSAALSSQFKPDYPPLAKLQARIHELQLRRTGEVAKIVEGINSEYQEAQGKEDQLQAEMNRQRTETLNLNDAAAQYAILQRDVDTNHQLYNAILTRLKDVSISDNVQATNVSVVNSAEVPTVPTLPKKNRDMALATVIGLAGGIGLAFVLEFLDNTLKNPEDAENYLRLPNLGIVPEFSSINGKSLYGPRELSRQLSLDHDSHNSPALPPGKELVTSHGSYSSIGEAYRNIRTALLLSRAGGPPKITLITSAMSREGKTVTAVNSAVMLSQLGANTLLIDADLRRARCHRVLAVDNLLGLTEVLTGARDLREMVRSTEIPNLYFLSAGSVPPNPTELLNSAKMMDTMAQLKEHYEYIVIDSPPVLPVSDSLLLAKMTDGVVIVADASATPRHQVKAACARLEYARAKILGIILNKIKVNGPDYHYYYYHHDYYPPTGDSPRDDEEPV